jgi:hypothetical protein
VRRCLPINDSLQPAQDFVTSEFVDAIGQAMSRASFHDSVSDFAALVQPHGDCGQSAAAGCGDGLDEKCDRFVALATNH